MQLSLSRPGQINWIILGLYLICGIIMLINLKLHPTDKAGQGMALGFMMIYFILLLIGAGLNLIRYDWVRYVLMGLLIIPIILWVTQLLNSIKI